ncbi:MAG: hypothetical protein M1828_006629 [Chrysothrix sp. TS-e1954]|nr:MAG: hypothetical protein M1828_006629 [Chrysothrix sp. TS-e1954]
MSSPPTSPAPHYSPPPTAIDPQDPQLYQHLESYPWAGDSSFQSGLAAILGQSNGSEAMDNSDSARTDDLTLHARCFYYSRKFGISVDYHTYAAWRTEQPQNTLSPLEANIESTWESRGPATLDQLSDPIELVPNRMSETQSNGHVHREQRNTQLPDLQHEEHQQTDSSKEDAHEQQYHPADFEEISRLIANGERVPGIKDIPKTVLEGQGTEAMSPQRPKPWERSTDSASTRLFAGD